MIRGLICRLAAILGAITVAAGGASAQNFDGTGIIRFGVFGAGEFYDAKSTVAGIDGTSLDGAAVGISVGYDWVFARRLAMGIETDLTVGDVRGKIGGVPMHVDYMATVRARLGAYLHPDFMIYGTGGVAWAGLGLEDTAGGVTGGALDSNKTVYGYIVGGGMEYEFRDYFGTILFGEYLYGKFDSWDKPPGLTFGVDTEVHTFRIGVKFKVGHDYHAGRDSVGPLK